MSREHTVVLLAILSAASAAVMVLLLTRLLYGRADDFYRQMEKAKYVLRLVYASCPFCHGPTDLVPKQCLCLADHFKCRSCRVEFDVWPEGVVNKVG